MKASVRPAIGLAIAFLALHLPFIPVSLEDLDSINFALGLRHFDVAQHQPHPPGYPVFIALGHVANAVSSSEARALSLVSVVSGALAVLAMAALFAAWSRATVRRGLPCAGALVAAATPLFWMTAARPLSDMAGLAATLGVQLLTVMAETPNALALAALCAGLAAGIRSQVVWLTLPLLVLASFTQIKTHRAKTLFGIAVGYTIGGLLWGVPLLMLSGGPSAYLSALTNQGTEDFTGVAMLATRPSPRLLVAALYSTLIAPFEWWPLAIAVLLAAIVGTVACLRSDRRALVYLIAAFGPYALFDLLFQETATTRYALPLVVPLAYLAARGVTALSDRFGLTAAALIAVAGLAIAMPPLAAYARSPAPAFRVLEDMRAAQSGARPGDAPVLGMHRRQELDMRRPIVWNGDRLPTWSAHLPAPPKHEWMELVKYWNGGGRAPVWFLADPPRSDLRLIDPRSFTKRGEYRWSFDATNLLGGVRPNVMNWYQIDPPAWYMGEGWALTPETAGVANDEGRGLGRAPIQGWIRRPSEPVVLMIGGRNLAGEGGPVPITVTIDDRTVARLDEAPGFFLRFVTLGADVLAGAGSYATLSVTAGSDRVAIEQFDVQPRGRAVYGFGDGWQELEYNPATGRLWRWTTERAVIRLVAAPQALTLHLNGEFETSASTAHVIIRAGNQVLAEHDVAPRFTLDVPVPGAALSPLDGETALTIETDQWYIPADTNWRPTQDRRHLGLRLFECELRPAS